MKQRVVSDVIIVRLGCGHIGPPLEFRLGEHLGGLSRKVLAWIYE
jgi:hypothetical protein